jgi:hypothetical protein
MTVAQQRKRRLALIRILCELSRNGWTGARSEDYAPVEAELRELEK